MDRNDTLVASLPAIRRLASRQTFHRARAGVEYADLAQESALCFLEKWATFDGVHDNLFVRWMVSHARRRLHNQRRVPTEVLVDEPPAREPDPSPTERAEDAAARDRRARRLRTAVERLPARRREIVTQRYGLDGAAPRVQRELAGGLGVTKQRVQQLEAAALRQLAAALITTQETNP